jgi:hypothetical protein
MFTATETINVYFSCFSRNGNEEVFEYYNSSNFFVCLTKLFFLSLTVGCNITQYYNTTDTKIQNLCCNCKVQIILPNKHNNFTIISVIILIQ